MVDMIEFSSVGMNTKKQTHLYTYGILKYFWVASNTNWTEYYQFTNILGLPKTIKRLPKYVRFTNCEQF